MWLHPVDWVRLMRSVWCRATVVAALIVLWSCVFAGVAAADPPVASVRVTEYSPRVSGNIGEGVAGVGVTVSLVRAGGTVATGSGTTSGTGGWSVVLTAAMGLDHGVVPPGVFTDGLAVDYAPPAASPATVVPPDASYAFVAFSRDAHITPDGSTIIAEDGSVVSAPIGQPCPAVRFIVNGATKVPVFAAHHKCHYSPAAPLSDADHVQAQLTQTVSQNGGTSRVSGVVDAPLVGLGTRPTCTGDLVTKVVKCRPLDSGQFAISDNGGPLQPLTTTHKFSQPDFMGTATVAGLRAGHTVSLQETSAASRVLSTLHVLGLSEQQQAGVPWAGPARPANGPCSGCVRRRASCPSIAGEIPATSSMIAAAARRW